MKPQIRFPLRFSACILLLFVLITSALAGPPLICHRIEIGTAKSLPWAGDSWNLSGNESYDTRNLVRDTLAILDSNPPVLVRMETLRRATLYVRKDPQAAKELLTRLHTRATTQSTGALARFDFGYLAATYNEWLGLDKNLKNPAAGIDGYSVIKEALTLRGNDPEMEFAAALITLRGPEKDHQEHAQKAIAGAKGDALLAQNLASRFLGNEKQTVAEMLSRNTPWGGPEK
ncbi:MAG TPA: hypothetical protein VKY85_27665 [Candidatus Angelobacter sp.]|nr:hypothetical protein [Candidatus Angelobacter sp.]